MSTKLALLLLLLLLERLTPTVKFAKNVKINILKICSIVFCKLTHRICTSSFVRIRKTEGIAT